MKQPQGKRANGYDWDCSKVNEAIKKNAVINHVCGFSIVDEGTRTNEEK